MRRIFSWAVALPVLLLLAVAPSSTAAQSQSDIDGIHQLLDRYGELEDTGDMAAQAQMMTPDRVWIGGQGMGRRTDQSLNMRYQQAAKDQYQEVIPGIRFFSDLRDREIRFLGDGNVAVVSFYWYTDVILPVDAPPEVADYFVPPPPLAYTLVLERQGRDWKIAHTHWSQFFPN